MILSRSSNPGLADAPPIVLVKVTFGFLRFLWGFAGAALASRPVASGGTIPTSAGMLLRRQTAARYIPTDISWSTMPIAPSGKEYAGGALPVAGPAIKGSYLPASTRRQSTAAKRGGGKWMTLSATLHSCVTRAMPTQI
jgi:hypothetical protein